MVKMKSAFMLSALLVSLLLFGCIAQPPITEPTPTPTPTPIACTQEAMICPDGSAVGRVGPNCEFAPCPSATPTPAPTATPTPSGAHACDESIRNQLYARYQPTYCVGMPPCEPLNESQVKAIISVDLRQSPTLGFTYQQGNLCGITTYFGRGWIVPESCELHDPVITSQQTIPVPC